MFFLYLTMMNTAYLLLGGNMGNKQQNIASAMALIEQRVGAIIKKSNRFKTAAWGNENQPGFINQAVCIETILTANNLLIELLKIEEHLGRKRDSEKWMQRIIDIDILFYNDEIIDTPHLKIPHPFIQERNFVLVPLSQIAKEFVHPVLIRTVEQLVQECTDKLEVVKLNE